MEAPKSSQKPFIFFLNHVIAHYWIAPLCSSNDAFTSHPWLFMRVSKNPRKDIHLKMATAMFAETVENLPTFHAAFTRRPKLYVKLQPRIPEDKMTNVIFILRSYDV
jgi:hypothetical protein